MRSLVSSIHHAALTCRAWRACKGSDDHLTGQLNDINHHFAVESIIEGMPVTLMALFALNLQSLPCQLITCDPSTIAATFPPYVNQFPPSARTLSAVEAAALQGSRCPGLPLTPDGWLTVEFSRGSINRTDSRPVRPQGFFERVIEVELHGAAAAQSGSGSQHHSQCHEHREQAPPPAGRTICIASAPVCGNPPASPLRACHIRPEGCGHKRTQALSTCQRTRRCQPVSWNDWPASVCRPNARLSRRAHPLAAPAATTVCGYADGRGCERLLTRLPPDLRSSSPVLGRPPVASRGVSVVAQVTHTRMRSMSECRLSL